MLALPRILFALAVACGGVSAAGEEVRIIFRNSPLYPSLTTCQQKCAAGTGTYSFLYSVVGSLDCDERQCVCLDPQVISNLLDICLTKVTGNCYTLDNYNKVMEYFGLECNFQPTYKVRARTCDPTSHLLRLLFDYLPTLVLCYRCRYVREVIRYCTDDKELSHNAN